MKLVVCRRSLVVCVAVWAALLACNAQAVAQEAAASAEQQAPAGAAGHDGGFFVESDDGDHRLDISGRVQAQHRTRLADVNDGHELAEIGFLIRRARLKFDGHTLTPRLNYLLQLELGGGSVRPLEGFINYAFTPGCLEARIGRWRAPFLRHELSSSGYLLMVDRAPLTGVFGDSYETGVALHNDYTAGKPFEWVVGVFNGSTNRVGAVSFDDPDVPSVFGPELVSRLNYTFGGATPYRETTLADGPLRFSVGGAVAVDPGIERAEESTMKATLDYLVEVGAVSTTGGVVLATAQDGDGLDDQELFATGAFLQAGYLLSERVQPTGRYSLIDFSQSSERVHEALGGLNVYFYGHRFKLQTDAGAIITDDTVATRTDLTARTQLQLSF